MRRRKLKRWSTIVCHSIIIVQLIRFDAFAVTGNIHVIDDMVPTCGAGGKWLPEKTTPVQIVAKLS